MTCCPPATIQSVAGTTWFALGRIDVLERECLRVAIVGSRKASSAGQDAARRLARQLAAEGVVVVSGLAEGIDTAAHAGALEAPGGRTIAVIGTPLDRCYPPSNAKLQERLCREQLVVSMFPVGSKVRPQNFLDRNKVIVELSHAVVAITGDTRSGTAATARLALIMKRPTWSCQMPAMAKSGALVAWQASDWATCSTVGSCDYRHVIREATKFRDQHR